MKRNLSAFVFPLLLQAVLSSYAAAQASGTCDNLGITQPPTAVSVTYIRKGTGEFGAPRPSTGGHHQGTDIVMRLSSKDPSDYAVHAIASGVVAYARPNGDPGKGYGNVIVVDHRNGCYSFYAHLSGEPQTVPHPGDDLKVHLSDEVTGGQIIGYIRNVSADLDSTGNAVTQGPLFKNQVHIGLIEATSGRSSSGSLGTSILQPPAAWRDAGPLLMKLGYKVEDLAQP